jgi:HAD superfamily hydrolase (TIGR01490 family)
VNPAPASSGAAIARAAVAAFDVDGTLTPRDTLLPFLVRAFGPVRVALAFAALTPQALRFASGRITIDAFKCRVIERLFAGARVAHLQAVGRAYADVVRATIRPAALERLEWHRSRAHALVLVSASLDLYLEPLAAQLGVPHVLCTRLATRGAGGDVFSGAIEGEDCTGAAKVRRIVDRFGDLTGIELHAYGDSAGDRELLACADHRHFRPFR